MLNRERFDELISGRRRGAGAATARGLLSAFAALYGCGVELRNRLYDAAWLPAWRAAAPVICVGNITAGGTGKTPIVMWLARWLRAQGRRPAILSRGYRAGVSGQNDEFLEIRQRLPDLPHLQHRDRARIARQAIVEHRVDVLVLDDGFQHRRLARDLDIVLIDATEPFGHGHLLPRGYLREPISSLRRATAVGLTRTELVDAQQIDRLHQTVAAAAPNAIIFEAAVRPVGLLTSAAAASREVCHEPDRQALAKELSELARRRVAAFCGIGNPAAFRSTAESLCGQLVAWRTFPDHHPFDAGSMANLQQWAEQSNAEVLLCTHKDWVKLPSTQHARVPVAALVVDVEVLDRHGDFVSMLRRVIDREES